VIPARRAAFLSGAAVAIALARPRALAVEPWVAEAAALLTGTFEAGARSSAGGAPSRLVVVEVPKSRLGLGAPVLYWEEAPLADTAHPRRQRFLRVEEEGRPDEVLLRLFEPKVAVAVAGKWRDAADLALFGTNDVTVRPGCLVTLRRTGEKIFEGGTKGNGCPSALSGARFRTMRITLRADRIEILERGFDVKGKQVFGPIDEPDVYVRRSSGPPVETSPSAATPTSAPVPPVPTAPSPAPSPTPSPARRAAPDLGL